MPKNWSIWATTDYYTIKDSSRLDYLVNVEWRYKSAESMLSQKSGYKLDFISTYLRLVIDAKKMVNMSNNRLLNNKKLVKIRLFH